MFLSKHPNPGRQDIWGKGCNKNKVFTVAIQNICIKDNEEMMNFDNGL